RHALAGHGPPSVVHVPAPSHVSYVQSLASAVWHTCPAGLYSQVGAQQSKESLLASSQSSPAPTMPSPQSPPKRATKDDVALPTSSWPMATIFPSLCRTARSSPL